MAQNAETPGSTIRPPAGRVAGGQGNGSASRSLPHPTPSLPHRAARRRDDSVRHIVAILARLAVVQWRIALTHARLAVGTVILYSALLAVAVIWAGVAVLALYVGLLRLATDVLHVAPAWAYLAVGGLHLLLAGGLVFLIARRMLGERERASTPVRSADP